VTMAVKHNKPQAEVAQSKTKSKSN